MKKQLSIAFTILLFILGISSVQAATVKGDVKTNVKVGAVIQSNTGINLGSVTD
jgi:hypothetical protein